MVSDNRTEADLTLVICPPWDMKMPPLGLAYIAEFMRSKGYIVRVIDINISLYDHVTQKDKAFWEVTYINEWVMDSLHRKLFEGYSNFIRGITEDILRDSPGVICFSVNITNTPFTIELMKRIRSSAKDAAIGIGGPNSSPDIVEKCDLSKLIDFAIVGEAEYALQEAMAAIRDKKTLAGIPGIYLPGTAPMVSAKLIDVNQLAYPTYRDFSLEKYREKALPVSGSRGCYGKCNFCIDWVDNPYRSRKGELIYEEVEHHYRHYGIVNYRFTDLIINGNIRELEKFCDLLIKNNVKINWYSNAVINPALTAAVAMKMRESGCIYLEFGVESFSENVVGLMNKPFTHKHIRQVLRNVKDAGIRVGVNILLGFPGETEADFEDHQANLRNSRRDIDIIANLHPVYLYGNSKVNLFKERFGIDPDNADPIKWRTKDKDNTYEIRLGRVKRCRDLLRSLKLPYQIPHNSSVHEELIGLDKGEKNPDVLVISLPCQRTDCPPEWDARLMTILRRSGIHADHFDLNAYLFNCVRNAFEYLWWPENAALWLEDDALATILLNYNVYLENAASLIDEIKPQIIYVSLLKGQERIYDRLKAFLLKRYPVLRIICTQDLHSASTEIFPARTMSALRDADSQKFLKSIVPDPSLMDLTLYERKKAHISLDHLTLGKDDDDGVALVKEAFAAQALDELEISATSYQSIRQFLKGYRHSNLSLCLPSSEISADKNLGMADMRTEYVYRPGMPLRSRSLPEGSSLMLAGIPSGKGLSELARFISLNKKLKIALSSGWADRCIYTVGLGIGLPEERRMFYEELVSDGRRVFLVNPGDGRVSRIDHIIRERLLLLDEVILGRRDSEKSHVPLGTWRTGTHHITSHYGYPDNYELFKELSNAYVIDPRRHFWRNFAGVAGIVLRTKGYEGDLRLSIEIYDNSYNQGPGGWPTKVDISFDNITWISLGTFKITGQGKWTESEFVIKKEIVVSGEAHIRLDDMINFERGGYGKSVGAIRLYRDG